MSLSPCRRAGHLVCARSGVVNDGPLEPRNHQMRPLRVDLQRVAEEKGMEYRPLVR
jgi:hypothetical protein